VRFDIDAEGKDDETLCEFPRPRRVLRADAVDVDGESMAIALNYHYVFDCVNAAADRKELLLELQSNMQPGVFKSNGR